jgi:hypothetical protein
MCILKIKADNRVTVPILLMLAFVCFSNPSICLAEISVDSYCQLVIQSMQMEVANMQTIIDIINQYKEDAETLERQIELKQAQLDQTRNDLYSSYGITADDYVAYMGENVKKVNSYLKENPDVKQQIGDLSVQLKELINQEDALMASAEPSPPPVE